MNLADQVHTRQTSPFLWGGPSHGAPLPCPADGRMWILMPVMRRPSWSIEKEIGPESFLRPTVEYQRQTIAAGSQWWDLYCYSDYVNVVVNVLNRLPWLWVTP